MTQFALIILILAGAVFCCGVSIAKNLIRSREPEAIRQFREAREFLRSTRKTRGGEQLGMWLTSMK